MLDDYFVDTCTIIPYVRDEYGSFVDNGNGTTANCRFRDITDVRRESHGEVSDADAMLWLSPDEDVSRGTIILFDNTYYQIQEITKAKRLGETEVLFLKCELTVMRVVIS